MNKQMKFSLGMFLLLSVVAVAFSLGYFTKTEVAKTPSQSQKIDTSTLQKSPTLNPSQKQEKFNEIEDRLIARDFNEDRLPKFPDLQKEMSVQKVDRFKQVRTGRDEDSLIVETSTTTTDTSDPRFGKKSLYLVTPDSWQAIETDFPGYCVVVGEDVHDIYSNEGRKEKKWSRLIYQLECNLNSSVHLFDLVKKKAIPITGTNLPKWISAGLTDNGGLKGILGELVGYGPNLIFEVRSNCSGCERANPVIINGVTGKILNWFDYDKYAGQESNFFPGY